MCVVDYLFSLQQILSFTTTDSHVFVLTEDAVLSLKLGALRVYVHEILYIFLIFIF